MPNLRDIAEANCPSWLQNRVGKRLIYALSLPFDVLADALSAALEHRQPGLRDGQSLAVLGRERGVDRLPNESDESYASRLEQWLEHKKIAGTYLSMIQQIRLLMPDHHTFVVSIVNDNGYSYDKAIISGTDFGYNHGQLAWDWDGNHSNPHRYWVIIRCDYTTQGTFAAPGLWSSTSGIGSTATYDQITQIRKAIFNEQPAHATCAGIILVIDPSFYSELPQGNWNDWRNRSAKACYWDAWEDRT